MVAVYLTENQSVFTIQSADLSHIIGCDLDETKLPYSVVSHSSPK